MTLRFEPLTEELVLRYYGKPQPWTMRGCAVMRGDEVVGAFGIYRDKGFDIVFAKVNDDAWPKPPPLSTRRAIVSGMRMIARMKKSTKPLYAYAEPDQPNSELLLEHFGFERLKERVYRWPQHYPG